jgi:RimJ/RimL family protein N-acetyltransferase
VIARVEHAIQMWPVLDDPALHVYIGGEPPTLEQLQRRYALQVVGRSPDGSQQWLNWVLRRRDTGQLAGTVQATVSDLDGSVTAEIAWVIGTSHQGQGFAKEAARALVDWLREHGVRVVIAHVHPRHEASQAVAAAAGLKATETVVDGETRWQG